MGVCIELTCKTLVVCLCFFSLFEQTRQSLVFPGTGKWSHLTRRIGVLAALTCTVTGDCVELVFSISPDVTASLKFMWE